MALESNVSYDPETGTYKPTSETKYYKETDSKGVSKKTNSTQTSRPSGGGGKGRNITGKGKDFKPTKERTGVGGTVKKKTVEELESEAKQLEQVDPRVALAKKQQIKRLRDRQRVVEEINKQRRVDSEYQVTSKDIIEGLRQQRISIGDPRAYYYTI